MSLPVFLGPVSDARAGDVVVVEGDEAHHAVVVRRTKVGERVVLVDGEGTAATGTVEATAKTSMRVAVDDIARSPRPAPHVVVVQAIPKGDRGELAVEVLTEIGVDRILPWAAERCVGVWRGERVAKSLAKWRATAREAGKQSRRAWWPEVSEVASTEEVVAELAGADLAVVLHEAATAPFSALDVPATGSVVVVVGPEGGISEQELAAFGRVPTAQVVRMGEPVLRTSTAGVAAVAAILSRTPRWA